MKKWLFIFMTILILVSCGQTSNKQKKPVLTTGSTNADVTIRYKGVDNIERLNQFVENMKNNIPDKVRLIQYTTEGDPIYQLLNYDGKTIAYTLDNTHDNYSSAENRKKTTLQCKKIHRDESNTFTNYSLSGCPEEKTLFTVNHDVSKEDYFAFELKYGNNNVIDTKAMRLSRDLNNGNAVEVSDFHLKNYVLNQIYKEMVFSNYLADKHFSSQCQSKINYELLVWINSGERHFQWADCDKSQDGVEMTQLANKIIKIVQGTQVYREMMTNK